MDANKLVWPDKENVSTDADALLAEDDKKDCSLDPAIRVDEGAAVIAAEAVPSLVEAKALSLMVTSPSYPGLFSCRKKVSVRGR